MNPGQPSYWHIMSAELSQPIRSVRVMQKQTTKRAQTHHYWPFVHQTNDNQCIGKETNGQASPCLGVSMFDFRVVSIHGGRDMTTDQLKAASAGWAYQTWLAITGRQVSIQCRSEEHEEDSINWSMKERNIYTWGKWQKADGDDSWLPQWTSPLSR